MHKQQLLDSAISGFLDLLQTRIQEEEFNVNPDNLTEERVRITALDSDGEPLQYSEQGLDEWGSAEDLVAKEWGGATAESLASFFGKAAEKMDLPALTATELEQAVHLEIRIGDPEDQGIRSCMPLYPMRHLNPKHIIVDDFGDYAFTKALSWNICHGRIGGRSRTYSDYYASSTYNANGDTKALRGNCIVLFSDGYIQPIQMILHEDHRGVEILLNQLPWGPAPLVSLDKELRVTATHEVQGVEPHLDPTSFDSIHHLIDTLDRTFFYDNFDTY